MNSFDTYALEALYLVIDCLQAESNKQQEIQNYQPHLFILIKKSLLLYLETGFKLCSEGLASSKLVDIAVLWLKILRPWRNGNPIFEASLKLDNDEKFFTF